MERGEIECEVLRVSDSSETDFSDEIEEEFSAVMENVKSEIDIKPVVSPEIFEEYLQYCEVSLELRCRLCAIPDNDMVNIFNIDEMEQSIIEKIERCLPIVVRETDPLSKHACRSCLASLELCYQFHKTVTKAEQQLLALERPTQEPTNRKLPIRSDNKRPLEQSSDAESSSKKRRTLVVQNNVEFVDLECRLTSSNKQRTLVVQDNVEFVDLECRLTSSNKRRTLDVQDNVELVDLESRSSPPCDARALGNNNSNTKRSRNSSDAKSSMETSTPIHNQENTCDLEVLEIAERTILRSQPKRKVKLNPIEPGIQEANNAYGCDFCPKKFNSKGRLVAHRKIHFRKLPYSLELSARDKTTSRRTSRRQALANDSEATNYSYFVCNELSNSPSPVNSPTVATESIQKWQCATCAESFWKIGDLNRHLKSCKLENPSP